jgi:hypothetical protein
MLSETQRRAIKARNDPARAGLPVGRGVIAAEPRTECEFSDRCSFRAEDRCPSCRFALCKGHSREESPHMSFGRREDEPEKPYCGVCFAPFPESAGD